MKVITVRVDEHGAVTVEADGAPGASCKTLTADIERALGAVTKDTKKPEYFQAAGNAAQQQRF